MRATRGLEGFLRRALPRLGGGVAVLYLVFAALNVVLRPPHAVPWFVAGSLACAGVGLAVGALARRAWFRDAHAHPVTLALYACVVADQFQGYLLLREGISFGYMALVIIAAGVVLTSRAWFVAAMGVAAAACVPMLLLHGFPEAGAHVLLLVGAVGIGALAFEARRANHVRLDEAVHAAEERKRLLEDFLARAPIGIYRTTMEGRVLLANPALERATGYTREDMENMNLNRSSAANYDRATFLRRLRDEGGVQGLEATWTRKDGSIVHVRESARLVRDPDGVEYIEGVLEDVTAEREARDLAERQDRLAAVGCLVAGVAHEVNNPLAYLRGNVQMSHEILESWSKGDAAPDPATLAETAEMQRVALQGIDRIAHIVKALRLVAQPPRAERSAQLVDPVIESVVLVAQSRARDHVGIRAELRSSVLVDIDDKALAQAALNLLLNAVDAAADVGEGLVVVRTTDEADAVVLEVADNGRGIPAKVQAQLFTPFLTTKRHGSGLGLPITQQIVQAHGGTIGVRTGPSGTTFTIRLPRGPRAAEAPHAAPTARRSG